MNADHYSYNSSNIFPASLIQLQFWVIHEFNPDSPAYNLPSVSAIEGNLDMVALETAINNIMRRYPVFRATFDIDESGALIQKIAPWEKTSLPYEDLRSSQNAAADNIVEEQAVTGEIQRPFDLASGPPIRFRLYRTGEHAFLFVITAHHIVFDLVTKDLFAETLEKEYKSALLTETAPESVETADYAFFSNWQKDWMLSADYKKMEESWCHYLDGAKSSLTWLTNKPSETASINKKTILPVPIKLSNDLYKKVDTFCRNEKTTPFLVLLTAWALTLARYSGQAELCVGVPLTNRRKEEFKNTMGCFVNSLPLAFDISNNPTIFEALRQIRMGMLQLHRMQEMPYYHLVQLMRQDGAIGSNTLYRAGFTFEHPMHLRLEGLHVEPQYKHPGGAQLDLFATFWHGTDSIVGVIKYESDLFDTQTVERIGEDMLYTANVICEHPEQNVDHITLMPVNIPDDRAKHFSDRQPVEVENTVSDEAQPVLAISASFTAEVLREFLEFWFQRLGWNNNIQFAQFNQVFQELLNPSSLLRSNRQGHNVIMVRLDDLLDGGLESLSRSSNEKDTRLAQVLDELLHAVSGAVRNMSVPLLFGLCPSSPNGEEALNFQRETVERFLEGLRSLPGVTVFTYQDICHRYPVADYYEPFGESLGHIPFTRPYLAALGTMIVRSLHTLSLKPIKALAVDCDGTLWQGVAAEDGATGVIIGPWQKAFQNFLLGQHQAGVVLCLCSKNQESDVWAVFDENPDMLLRREHFPFWRINWETKSSNIHALAREINIGLDAIAFLDDSPLERAEVSARCPTVLCLEFPDAWEDRTAWLEHVWLLDHGHVTAEDQKRQEHYRSERIRENLKQSAGSLNDFLEKLELKIDLNAADETDYERLSQLSVRTNQFNTTTLRLTPQEVTEYATTPGMSAHIARVRDRFGDYGLVGGMLAHSDGKSFYVDGMFLSCRALGRSVEFRMASYLASIAKDASCPEIVFPVRTTERNEPARTFLSRLNELCGGTHDDKNRLHLNTEQLSEFRYESLPTPEETTESSAPSEIPDSSNESPSQDRELFISIAGELRSADAILNATEQRSLSLKNVNTQQSAFGPTVPPETETEQLIADIWKRILGLVEINTQAKFFEVGGTSLLMARIAIELRRNHGFEVSIMDMFQYPTISGLAGYLDQKTPSGDVVSQAAESAARQREALSAKNLPNAFKRLKKVRG